MRKLIGLLAALFAFTWVAIGSAEASATWKHFGADPAYKTRAEAIADASSVLKRVGYPSCAIALFQEAMKKPGTKVRVVNGDRLDFMRSGTKSLWRNVLVDFEESPSKNMEYAAPAEEWTVTCNGQTYIVGLPEVCNNLYGRRPGSVPRRAPEECAYIQMEVRPGDTAVTFALMGRFAPSHCFALQRPSSDVWEPLPTHCPHGPCDFRRVLQSTRLSLTQSGGWSVADNPGWYVVRVSKEYAESTETMTVFCLARGAEHSDSMWVIREGYRTRKDRLVATLWYSKEEVPPEQPLIYWPWGEYPSQ